MASVAIIYSMRNPTLLCIEIKTDGHPIVLVRRQLCFLGGNWIGENAKGDVGPLDTLRREIREELSLDRPSGSSVELMLLGQAATQLFEPTPISGKLITPGDVNDLFGIRETICYKAVPFGSYLNTVTREALDAADPNNKRNGFTTLACYFAVPLNDEEWETLVRLQMDFGNLSNESITLLTSLPEMVRLRTKTAFGHDQVLRDFFLAMGLSEAKNLSMVLGITSQFAGPPMATYQDYLAVYDIAKKP
jgi:hypothetical protein